jgi:hypothetical protein
VDELAEPAADEEPISGAPTSLPDSTWIGGLVRRERCSVSVN